MVTQSRMYIVENRNTRPQFNLALEEYLCRRAMSDGLQFFMLWRNEPSIIVGRFQNTLEEIDAAFVRAHDIHLVRRNTGGGAVYHDLGNINYSIIAPDSGGFDFALFSQPIIRALATLGVEAEAAGRNDLTIGGKKISGGAQSRRGGITLHHGTLLYDVDLDVLSKALHPSADKFQSKAVKSVQSRVANIKPYLPEPLSVLEFQERLQSAIEDQMHPSRETFVLGWLDEVERLAREKYSSWEWNYGESPRFTERKKMRFPWGGVEAFLLVEEGKIAGCSLFGDYFGSSDNLPLLSRLIGVPYTQEGVATALAGFDPSGLFAGSKIEDIVALLTPAM